MTSGFRVGLGRDRYGLLESRRRGSEGSLPSHFARWVRRAGIESVRMRYGARVHTFGIRFHPTRGAGFLGQTAPTLTDKLLPLAQVRHPLDRTFAQLVVKNERTWKPTPAARRLIVLLQQLHLALPPDHAVVTLVDRLSCSETAPLVSEIARELGLSSRQLQRRFLAAVGVPPKRFVRVLRFARVWQRT